MHQQRPRLDLVGVVDPVDLHGDSHDTPFARRTIDRTPPRGRSLTHNRSPTSGTSGTSENRGGRPSSIVVNAPGRVVARPRWVSEWPT
jgi:hypothetical protein